MENDSLMTVAEVAAILGLKPGTLRVAVAAGKMKAVRLGGTKARAGMLLISRTEMEEYRRNRLGKRGKRGATKERKAEPVTTAA